jgi:O-6-methylguanine DNA methyltransferase
LVVRPHGGPWAKDNWGFVPEVQFLVDRGFAVLQPNFRGSTGFGAQHLRLSYRQWGGTMIDDMLADNHFFGAAASEPGAPRGLLLVSSASSKTAMATAAHLARCFEGADPGFDVPLRLRGTPFQQSVWTALRTIPRGATVSYATLARQVGAPAAVRAVGGAVGRNPVSVFVPCHRVVGANGTLTGYAAGLWRKMDLLQREGTLL